MKISEILKATNHRPWNLPSEGWKYYQEWNNAVFLHWQVDYDALRSLVPPGLEIDLFAGKPWISIVAFSMENVRMKNLPAFKPISDFHEINIRTYVKSNNKTGVYFLSIEGGKKLSCTIARKISELPYCYSPMTRTKFEYKSKNNEYRNVFEVEYTIGDELTSKSLHDKWLTERYMLVQDIRNAINEFEIHHIEWPLFEVEIAKLKLNYPRFEALISCSPHKTHYSPGVQVIAWGKKTFQNHLS